MGSHGTKGPTSHVVTHFLGRDSLGISARFPGNLMMEFLPGKGGWRRPNS